MITHQLLDQLPSRQRSFWTASTCENSQTCGDSWTCPVATAQCVAFWILLPRPCSKSFHDGILVHYFWELGWPLWVFYEISLWRKNEYCCGGGFLICSFLRVQVSVVQPLGTLDTAEPIVVSLLADHHAADSKLMPNPPGPSSYRTPGNIMERWSL